MEIRHYPAIMYQGSEGIWVGFPDIPGCVSFGNTIQHAATQAEEALSGHVALMVRDGDPLPEPTPMDHLDEVAPDPEDSVEVARLLVRVEIPAKWIRLNMTMAENLVIRVDHAAKELGMSRSGFLAEAARRMLDSAG
ncbi:type II toxin-antitoxin system HicB family antitoxin [Candidatus Magnetaquicoccus inordinatus]|uniref:type II toxin-antitoxin system HicB family antitoxin n=1 Tax=Candidatus Magnetaquicoccus inordinatus TaxID=2496818 RepID=UPI00102BE3A4|nr:type II toxin-antitoxin system HicB family antitoxin [Candidatus Magnetaquicoccus inordinatus]